MGLSTKQKMFVLLMAALLSLTVVGRTSYSRHLHGLMCAARTYHRVAIANDGDQRTSAEVPAAAIATVTATATDRPQSGKGIVAVIREHQKGVRKQRAEELQLALRQGLYDRRLAKKQRQQRERDGGAGSAAAEEVTDSRRVLPQALVIGVRKCGTRALLEMLEMHPQVAASGPEVHFFDRHYDQGLDWYRRQMPASRPGQLTMEKTPSYYVTAEAPERIHQATPSAKLLVIVRDPTTRVVSDYTQIASKDPARFSAEDFVATVLDERGRVRTSYRAVQLSVYADFLPGWLRLFPRGQLHFVDGDRLVTDPFPQIKEVEAFLGIADFITADKFEFNPDTGFYCLTGELNKKCLSASKGRQHPDVPPDILAKLRDFFRPHNERFFQMIGRRFDWA